MMLFIDQSRFDRSVITLRENQQFLCIREAYLCCPTLVLEIMYYLCFPLWGS